MLRSLKALKGNHVHASDGDVGKVTDLYFDDEHWTVRYLVVDTSAFWEARHEVLISPNAFRSADWQARLIELDLTQETVRNSPAVDLAKPLSRQFEEEYHKYYNWPFYWLYTDVGSMMPATEAVAAESRSKAKDASRRNVDQHLQSFADVSHYRVHATDGEIGDVEDCIINDESWKVRYLAVSTSKWWFGKSVLVAPGWVQRTDWAEGSMHLNLPREVIKHSPEWRPDQPVNREYEVRLYDYYGRPAYWREEPSRDGNVDAGQRTSSHR